MVQRIYSFQPCVINVYIIVFVSQVGGAKITWTGYLLLHYCNIAVNEVKEKYTETSENYE